MSVWCNGRLVAVWERSRGQANRLFLSAAFVCPVDHSALYRTIGLNIEWQAVQVTCDPAAILVKQSCEPNASRVLLHMLIDRLQPPLRRQVGNDTHLRGDHMGGSHRQVMLGFQVDKSEQRDGKSRKYARHQPGPPH